MAEAAEKDSGDKLTPTDGLDSYLKSSYTHSASHSPILARRTATTVTSDDEGVHVGSRSPATPKRRIRKTVPKLDSDDEDISRYCYDEDGPSPLERLREKWRMADDPEEECNLSRHAAGKLFEDKVKDCYSKAQRLVERGRSEMAVTQMDSGRRHLIGGELSMKVMEEERDTFRPRHRSWYVTGAIEPRGMRSVSVDENGSGSGPYCAPALNRSIRHGVESRVKRRGVSPSSDDDSYVPFEYTRGDRHHLAQGFTGHPVSHSSSASATLFGQPSITGARAARMPGSDSEDDEAETTAALTTARSYYSRRNRDDPDYFDYDLDHAVREVKRATYTPRYTPKYWEHKVFTNAMKQGGEGTAKAIAPHMFLNENDGEWRETNSGLISSALRTPSFWTHQFENLLTKK